MKELFLLNIASLAIGFVLDALLGDPLWLYHPVIAIGKYISFMEKRLRRRGGDLRKRALILTSSTVLIAMLAASAILTPLYFAGKLWLLTGMSLLNWLGLAARSMVREARGVEKSFSRGLENARNQVARIVGRDTQSLSEQEIIKATVETTAENTTDGVISPMVYALIGGPVLLWGFKAASTLDSMVGYLDEKYRDIGWSSAKLDDILNWVPARLTALLMVCAAYLVGLDGKNALRVVRRDHANHLSPNCAWSEAAAAGSLHIQLGGAHEYFGKTVYKPSIGDDDRPAEKGDIDKTCKLLYTSSSLFLLIILASGLVICLCK